MAQSGASCFSSISRLRWHTVFVVDWYCSRNRYTLLHWRTFTLLAGNPKGGYGGVLSFELKGGQKAADAFQAALQIGFVAPSLGGVETLVRSMLWYLSSHSSFRVAIKLFGHAVHSQIPSSWRWRVQRVPATKARAQSRWEHAWMRAPTIAHARAGALGLKKTGDWATHSHFLAGLFVLTWQQG